MQTEKNFAERRAQLSSAKQTLLENRLKRLGGQPAIVPTIGPRPAAATVPLSFAQQRLWFLQQLEPESAAYNEALATRLQGPLNQAAFTRTIREIIGRHEVLRCRFPLREGQVVQVVDQDVAQTFAIPYEDWRGLAAQQRETAVHRRARAEMERPFDLAEELPWRTFLFQLADEEYLSLSILHHIITDGWSIGVLYREIGHLYEAFSTGKASPLPPLPVQYGDYAYWQHQWIDGKEASEQLAYWQQQLHSPLPVLDLPVDRVRLLEPSYRGQRVPLQVPQSVSQQVQNVCRQTGATPFMVLLTGLLIVLQRYSGQDDLVVGTPIAGRMRPEVEALMGCFVNTLVLRAKLGGEPTVRALIQQVREVTLQAYDQQEVPFEKLVEVLQPERNLSRNPLFQVMFVLQNVPVARLSFQSLDLLPVEVETHTAKFDLELIMEETEQGFSGYLEYNLDVFDASTVERIAQHFVQILAAMTADLEQRISVLPLLTPEEEKVVAEWFATQRPYPDEKSYHEYFAAQVERNPDAVAVSDADEQLSYRELDQWAERIAAHLQTHNIQPERLVGLYTERNVYWAAAVVGIFKAGGVYLPLDPHHPSARLHYILDHSSCQFVLTTRTLAGQLSELLGDCEVEVRCLEELLAEEVSQPWQPGAYSARQLAYVIYTSGSTGKPKGVMVEQRGMLNHLYAKVETLGLTAADVVAQTATQCFDISVWQLLAAWLVGGQVRIYAENVVVDAPGIRERLEQDEVSIVEVVPSFLRVLLEVGEKGEKHAWEGDFRCLRWMIATGEALAGNLCQQWLERYPAIPMLNAYGPTECSDDVSHHIILTVPDEDEVTRGVPVGKAIANMRVYVLNRQQDFQPVGIAGEVYVGGVGVGRGYVGDAMRTAEVFMPDPWSKVAGGRMYRTGDIGKYRADGAIEYLGRTDQQVKVRGYRIELGEIEAAFKEYPTVQECVVVAREQSSGDKRLVAYLVVGSHEMTKSSDVYDHLKARLPEYMVPSSFVLLNALPLLPNGKLDRQALPELGEEEGRGDVAYVAPRTPLEEQLVAIWAEVLALKQVGVSDNFFTIGGHSLLITQVLARVRDAFEVTLPVRTLFKNPTIAGLAEAIEKVRSRSTELRKQTVVSISRDAYRQKRSSLVTPSDKSS